MSEHTIDVLSELGFGVVEMHGLPRAERRQLAAARVRTAARSSLMAVLITAEGDLPDAQPLVNVPGEDLSHDLGV